jgi:hypothetical protein
MARTYFKVIKDPMDRFQISIGVGKIYGAKDIEEVKEALDHYFVNSDLGNNPKCPLCRAINEEMAARKRKSY